MSEPARVFSRKVTGMVNPRESLPLPSAWLGFLLAGGSTLPQNQKETVLPNQAMSNSASSLASQERCCHHGYKNESRLLTTLVPHCIPQAELVLSS